MKSCPVVQLALDESRGVYLDSLDMGDYVKVKAVDFGEEGARSVRLCVRQRENDGFIQVCIDSQSNVVATVDVSGVQDWVELAADLNEVVTGVHDIYFRFRATDTGSGMNSCNSTIGTFCHRRCRVWNPVKP